MTSPATPTATPHARRAAPVSRGAIGLCVAAAVAASTLAGLIAHSAWPATFEATAVVAVVSQNPAHVDMAAEQALAASSEVTLEALAAAGLGPVRADAAGAATRVRAVAGSRTLRIAYRSPDAAESARLASALAYAYVAVRSLRPDLSGHPSATATVVAPAEVPQAQLGPGRATSGVAAGVLGLIVAAPLGAARAGLATRRQATGAS